MTKPFYNDTFAVVDLETTGTQRENDNHIIQFGCAIIKKRKVVKTYSFMINPHREIPLSIQNLTGISNEDIATKKDFSYYAPKIIKILKNTVFVAHNINFDLPFLNYELTNNGYEPINNRAIDTVELAKIAFPTLPSYKLSDLTSKLKIKHLNPHKADSDAYGTAILLLDIIKRLEQLPQATLNTLGSLSSGLVRDTSWIINKISDYYRQKKRPLPKEFMQVRNIILQKQVDQQENFAGDSPVFPKNNDQKKKMFKGYLRYRKAQVELINHIHDFINDQNDRAMMVEAPNGTGKTFSYLFSYAYQLYSGRKLVIATSTKILQDQIVEKEIPQMLKVTKLDLKAEVVKASSHYIDLDGFVQTLFKDAPNKPTLVLQMQILVWLTKTKTGDLDELQLTSYNSPFFSQISHPGDARVGSRFASVDFWNLARKNQEEADILVTNHAYLANHYTDTIWGQNPYLVIDEAHRFNDNVMTSRNDSLQFESLWGVLSHLRNLLYYSDDCVQTQFVDDIELNFLLKKLDPEILELIYKINDFQKLLYDQKDAALSNEILANGNLELCFQGKKLFANKDNFQSELNLFEQKLEQVRQETNQILFKLYQKQTSLLINDESLLSELSEQIDKLDFYSEKAYQLADLLSDDNILEQIGFILIATNPEDPLSTNLNWMMLDVSSELENIYDSFSHILFVSATLTVNKQFDYSINQLALQKLKPITFIGKSTFNLKNHLEVLAVRDLPIPNTPEYEQVLSNIITNDLKKKNHVLILMTNLEKIREIFSNIINNTQLKNFEILAQGITGSNKRIAKRFGIAKRAIIIGADSFWEGIDFHNCGIDLVIATKLPFASPDQPEIKLNQKRLLDLGIDVFKHDSLPRAIVKFRQGMGRLIRGEHDHGQFVILDSRLWNQEYGQEFINAIPVKTEIITEKQLKDKLNNYDLKRRYKKNH